MSLGRCPALFAAVVLCLVGVTPAHPAADSGRALAEELKGRGIRDASVLDAIARVRRDAFVPAELRERAYEDTALPIGHAQTISQPYIVALMTELLGVRRSDRVLEIGTGSGYHTAILAELAREVYSVEIVPALATSARLRLTRMGYRSVHVKEGDGALGWREYGPYDAVLVTAVAPRVPPKLVEQLREGGVLVMPLGETTGRQVLIRGVKRGTKLRAREVTEVRFVPMTGDEVRRSGGVKENDGRPSDVLVEDGRRGRDDGDDAPAVRDMPADGY